ncbi:hypothetical protein ACDF64_10120 [Agromyces sp. MMS24-JH15]|uniref:hypothetical protein n=1 Tax=Agromyces sp. MMS24-JH15 TaxID=3243765 RepID=UPI003747FCCC
MSRPGRAAARRRAAGAGAVALALAFGLAACEAPPWVTASPTPSVTEEPTPTPTPTPNDLAEGSLHRSLTVGPVALEVDYWSTLSMDGWTAYVNKPLSMSLRGTLTPSDGQRLYLNRVTMVPVVNGPEGELPGIEYIFDQATVSPGYLILDPYTYTQTFLVPAVDPAATSITLTIRYELLVQSTPTSTDYAKQTAIDTLTIAIAPLEDADDEEGEGEGDGESGG